MTFINKKSIFILLPLILLFIAIDCTNKYFRYELATASKIISGYIFNILYHNDITKRDSIYATYQKGAHIVKSDRFISDIGKLKVNDNFILIESSFKKTAIPVPFIYSPENADSLFVLKSNIDTLLQKHTTDELDAAIALGSWVGSLWDHGADVKINTKLTTASDFLDLGLAGKKLWCEAAAVMTVKTFSSVNWPARLLTLSKNGEFDDHGIAEVWCNKFNTWLIIDADFNVAFRDDGKPLSAYELCHWDCRAKKPDTIQLGKPKPSLPYIDLMPFFSIVSIDLRNDWDYRHLRRGSPSGGALSTIWTSRKMPLFFLWPGRKINTIETFNWKLNNVQLYFVEEKNSADGIVVSLKLSTFSPYFDHFEISTREKEWIRCEGNYNWRIGTGPCKLKARVITKGPFNGPIDSCTVQQL